MDPASSALRDLEEALEVGTPDEVVAAAAALRQVVAARAGAEPARALLGQLLAVAEAGAAIDRGEAARVCAQVRAAGLGADAPPAPPPPPADAGPDGWTVGADSADMLADFAVEARGLLDEAEGACLALDHGITPAAIAMAFRAFHTIKGVAGFLELTVLATVAHRIESVLSEVRDGAPPPDGFVDLILRSIDVVRAGVAVAARGGAGARPDVDGLLREIEAALAGLAQRTTESQPTIMLPVIPQAATRAIRIDDLDERAVVKVDITKMDHIIDLVGELAIAQAQVAGHPALAAIVRESAARSASWAASPRSCSTRRWRCGWSRSRARSTGWRASRATPPAAWPSRWRSWSRAATPSSTARWSRRSTTRWSTWCATPSITASRARSSGSGAARPRPGR